MVFAVEKFLQSSNGTGRKEKGLTAILFSLKKQHSLFAELLEVPVVDSITADWSENHLHLLVENEVAELSNTSRSLFVRMRVEVDENGNPGIPNLEPLSSFMSPNKAYRYSSDGLQDLLKREIRSTNRQLLVRWFWIESNIVEDPMSASNRACEVIVQFALANNDLKKRKRSEYEASSPTDVDLDSTYLLRNMNSLLEKMYSSQLSHYARVEGLLNMLVTKGNETSPQTQFQSYTQNVRQSTSNEQQAPPMPAHPSSSQPPAVPQVPMMFRNSFLPDGSTWESLFRGDASSPSS